jgi:hypothetical protein
MSLFDTEQNYTSPDKKITIPKKELSIYLQSRSGPESKTSLITPIANNVPTPTVVPQKYNDGTKNIQTQKANQATLSAIPIQILPFPPNDKDYIIDNNTNIVNVTEPIWDTNDYLQTYDHKGIYRASASSVNSSQGINYQPANAFNHSISGWKSGLNDKYTYSRYGPSYYNSSVTTTVKQEKLENKSFGTSNIKGEWLQVQLPPDKPIYLFQYRITVPAPLPPSDKYTYSPKEDRLPFQAVPPPDGYTSIFPKVFSVVGSIDGINWYYVDQQSFVEPPDVPSTTPYGNSNLNFKKGVRKDPIYENTIIFDINSITRYTYYRLIVTELFPGNDNTQISQWQLFAFVNGITPNARTLVESFSQNYVQGIEGMESTPFWDSFSNYIHPELKEKHQQQLSSLEKAKESSDPLPLLSSYNISIMNNKENFDTHGFVKYDNGTSNRTFVKDNQLAPMNAIYADYLSKQQSINKNYSDLRQNIVDLNTNRSAVAIADGDRYDFNASNFNKPPNKMDGWLSDNKQIVMQQNSMFILSTITVATLVLALIISSK